MHKELNTAGLGTLADEADEMLCTLRAHTTARTCPASWSAIAFYSVKAIVAALLTIAQSIERRL